MLKTPVVFIIYNRPHMVERVFARIREVKPSKLFVVADGPRQDRPSDAEMCGVVRSIVDRVDWECEVIKNYSDVNLGCGLRISSGITWVFEHVEEAIIIEDDCMPDPTFFRFCEDLLERFCHDERVMAISGASSLTDASRTSYSYFFSRIFSPWGWATWRRAWKHFDHDMKLWPLLRDSDWLSDILGDPEGVEFWRSICETAYESAGNVDYWGYQWGFSCWAQNGFVVLPYDNLVSNIGYGQDATHTRNTKNVNANFPISEIKFPLRHPPYLVRDTEADRIRVKQGNLSNRRRKQPVLYHRFRRILSNIIPAQVRRLISYRR